MSIASQDREDPFDIKPYEQGTVLTEPCHFCGSGRCRMILRRLLCMVLGHSWSKDRGDWHDSGAVLNECYRCSLLRAIVVSDKAAAMLSVLREPYSTWKAEQSLPGRVR